MSVTTQPATRAEVEEAIHGHLATLRRMPEHWVDRRAALHEKINTLLFLWQELG